jgi:hypothetical protein
VCLVVGDSLLVVDAAVQGDVDAEGQESHAASLNHTLLAMERQAVAELVAEPGDGEGGVCRLEPVIVRTDGRVQSNASDTDGPARPTLMPFGTSSIAATAPPKGSRPS